jgi:membrane associated rhomboid family serine protease
MTMGLVGAFVACFVLSRPIVSNLLSDGFFLAGFFWFGDWDRPLIAPFLHANEFHALANTMLLLFVGPAVERYYGRLRLPVVFLASALLATAATAAFAPSAAVVTASGGVFGLVGLLVGFLVLHPGALPQVVEKRMITVLGIGVLVDVATGFAAPLLNNIVHVAGLAAGFLFAFIAQPVTEARARPAHAAAAALAVALGLVALMHGTETKAHDTLPYEYRTAEYDLAAGRVERAIATLEPALARDDRGSGSTLLRPVAQNALAWAYVLSGRRVKEGIALSEESNRIYRDQPEFLDTLGYLYAIEGRCREAADVMGKAAEISRGAFDRRRDEVNAACAAGRRPDPELPRDDPRPELEATPPPGRGKGIRV